MNKQELIKRIKDLPYKEGLIADTITINRNWMVESIEQLDEPQKVTIPQFVAEIIEYYKKQNATLYDALREKNFNKLYNDWLLNELDAYDKVARAWLDGYEIEEEKRYLVKMKAIEDHNSYLKYNTNQKIWYFGSLFIYANDVDTKTHHTRKELEEDGLVEVFNSPLFEIEEVK